MYIHSPLKIFAVGGSLVTSSSLWFFHSKPNLSEIIPQISVSELREDQTQNDQPEQTKIPLPTAVDTQTPKLTQEPASLDPIELNTLPPIHKLEGRDGTPIKNPNMKPTTFYQNTGSYFKLLDNESRPEVYLSYVSNDVVDFLVNFSTTNVQYKNFNIEDIRIYLFTESPWINDTNEDQFGLELTKEEISELFLDTDEIRVKQLLLGLQNSLFWKRISENRYYQDIKYPNSLDDLREIKIKHFKKFDDLKNYVKAKVATCQDDTKACIPTHGELNYLETDSSQYFQNIWANK